MSPILQAVGAHRTLVLTPGGYSFYGSVSMADLDANELPVSFYRKTGIGNGTWGTRPHMPPPTPINEAAARSMSIGR